MEPTSPPPRPLKASETAVLDWLSDHADTDGCVSATRTQIAAALGLAGSTTQLAIAGLRDAGEISITTSRGGAPNLYCVGPTGPTDSDRPDRPTDRPTGPTDSPDSSRVGERARGGGPPPPSLELSGSPDPSTTASTDRPDRPTDRSDRPADRPIGNLAVAAAMEAARAAGSSIEPGVRARIGHAAQALAKDESVETILAAARRLGEGGYSDLYTAVRAIDRGAPPPPPAAVPVPEGSKLGEVVRLVRATWPRAVIDLEVWERELEKIPARYLLEAVRALAKEGGEFAPHWGQVHRKAWKIGVDDTERRRSAAERADLRARVTAIEEGR